ncbi:MAG TPA: hypothetical protein PLH25_06255 [Flavobacterium sp.]|jgi:hypothetical protein|nr:hypothetical protein [Flavobacterium sp.]HQW69253.1 hypothetical protein [Flavobacterium sp.]
MKRKLLVSLSIVVLLFASCSETDDLPLVNEANVVSKMTSGNWKVTKFIYQNTTKTADYNGVLFDFDAISVMLSNTGTVPVAGSWAVFNEGFDNDPDLVFTLALTSAEPRFTNISDDWYIVESTSTKLKLEDENPSTGDIDYLVFEKN